MGGAATLVKEPEAERPLPETQTLRVFAVEKDGEFLGEFQTTNGEPYGTTARFGPLGPETFYYATAGEAEETFERGGVQANDPQDPRVVPVKLTVEFGE